MTVSAFYVMFYSSKYHTKVGNGMVDCTCNLVAGTSSDTVHMNCRLEVVVNDCFSSKFIGTISQILPTLSLLCFVIKSSFLFTKVIDGVIWYIH